MQRLIVIIFCLIVSGCASTTDSKKNFFDSVLASNKGNILTPETALDIDWSQLGVGYKYVINKTYFDGEKTRIEYTIHKIEGDEFHVFRKFPKREKQEGFFFVKGEHFFGTESYPTKSMSGYGDCKLFKIGDCKYNHHNPKILKVSFENGIWTYQSRLTGLSTQTTRTVYDINGIILYSEVYQNYLAQGTSRSMYFERVKI